MIRSYRPELTTTDEARRRVKLLTEGGYVQIS